MRNFLQNEEFQLDEILFENRNKNYGAYALRNEADQILTKSMFIGIGVFAMIAISPLLINAFNNTETIIVKEVPPPYVMRDVDRIEKPPKQIQVTPPAQVIVNTIDSRVPTPTKDAKIEKVIPTKVDYNDAVAGTQDIIGTPPTTNYDPPAVIDIPVSTPSVTVPKVVDNSPQTTVDVSANFIGGIDAFRNKVVNQFDTSVMDGASSVVKTTVIFIVEKDGTISEIKATGANPDFNRSAEKTIKAIRGKWVPAKLNGENVRSYFKFPIKMKFE